MRTFLTIFGGLVVTGLVIISVFANFWFGTLLISGQERWLYGAIFGLLDALKTVLVPAAGFAVSAGLFWKGRVAFAVFGLLSTLSFSAEVGLYSITKNEVVGDAKAAHAAYEQVTADKTALKDKLASLGYVRAAGAIYADIAGKRIDRLYARSKECTDATATESRDLCQAIERLNAELATAQEAKALQGKLDDVSLRISKMNAADALKSIDPQAEALAKISGFSPDSVRTGLALLIAGLIEMASGLGFWLLMPAADPQKEEDAKPDKSKREPVKKAAVPQLATTPAPTVEPETCIVEKWAGETVIRRKDNFLLASELRSSFEAWCQANCLPPVNATTFGRRMTTLNFKRKKVGGSMRYEGVALRGEWPALKVISGARA
ncbi:MAG: hypothetical protein ACLPWS_04050 [Rhodomicrobium sp.]